MVSLNNTFNWYCVHALVKREHIAAANIELKVGVEVYCPRITYTKVTKMGKKRFTEALFPGYIFMRCENQKNFRHIMSMNGVKCIVKYGNHYPEIPASLIDSIKSAFGDDRVIVPDQQICPGDDVVVLNGPFSNFTAQVSQVSTGQNRVAMLMDMLGREIEVSMPIDSVFSKENSPRRALTL